jgi:succinyl-diaminopimelate desuccinylase
MTGPADPVAIARDLIRCPSVTPAEGGALAYLDRVLGGAGFAVHRLTFSEPGTADVENLYARIGAGAPHLMFAGHTDVVPPGDAAAWTHAPFAADVADGMLFGRGAADMKGAIACKLAAVLDHLAARGGRPKGSISSSPATRRALRSTAPSSCSHGPRRAAKNSITAFLVSRPTRTRSAT